MKIDWPLLKSVFMKMVGIKNFNFSEVIKGIIGYSFKLWATSRAMAISMSIVIAAFHFIVVVVINEGFGGLSGLFVPQPTLFFPFSCIGWTVFSFALSGYASYRLALIKRESISGSRAAVVIALFGVYFVIRHILLSERAWADDGGWVENGGIWGYFFNPNSYITLITDIISGILGGTGWVAGDTFGTDLAGTLSGMEKPPSELELVDSLGKKHTYELDPRTGKYINILTGGELDPDRWDEYNKNLLDDRKFADEQMKKLINRDTAHDRALDEMVNRQKFEKKVMENLQKVRNDIFMGKKGTEWLWKGKGAPGDVTTQIEKMLKQLTNNKGVDIEKYKKITGLYNDTVKGKVSGEDRLISRTRQLGDTIKDFVKKTSREIITSRDDEGNISWKSCGVRLGLAALTFGKSEVIFTPLKSLYTMKDYVDGGGNSSLIGFVYTIPDIITGHAIGSATSGGVEGIKKSITDGMQNIKNRIKSWRSPKTGSSSGGGFNPEVSGHGPGSGAQNVSLEAINRSKHYKIFQNINGKPVQIPYSAGVEDMPGVFMVPSGGLADSIVSQTGKITIKNVIINSTNSSQHFQNVKAALEVLDTIY